MREKAQANDCVKGLRREICGEEILVEGLHIAAQARRDLRLGYREHLAGEVQEREISFGIQKRDGGGTVAAANVEDAGEFAIAKEILDGVGADVDVIAPAVKIRLRRFEEGLYFVKLGAHGAEEDGRDFMEATILILKGEAGAAKSRWG